MEIKAAPWKGCKILKGCLAPFQGARRDCSPPVVFAALRPPATLSQPFGLPSPSNSQFRTDPTMTNVKQSDPAHTASARSHLRHEGGLTYVYSAAFRQSAGDHLRADRVCRPGWEGCCNVCRRRPRANDRNCALP